MCYDDWSNILAQPILRTNKYFHRIIFMYKFFKKILTWQLTLLFYAIFMKNQIITKMVN